MRSSRGAWRTDPTRNGVGRDDFGVLAGAESRQLRQYRSIQLSSQRARAALGRRGPAPLLRPNEAVARQRERFARIRSAVVRCAARPPEFARIATGTSALHRLIARNG